VSCAHLAAVEPALSKTFEMATPIQSPAKCEVQSVVQFLNAKGEHPAETHKQIVAVYNDIMNRQNVMKWCGEFFEGGLMFTMNKGAVSHL
jgi:glutamate racemase